MLERLRARACEITVQETGGPGDAERFAAAADPARYDALVVAGGDGTVNEAIKGLGDLRLPLALLPLGTANVLAAEIGLDSDPDAVARPSRTAARSRSRSAPPTAGASS